MDLKTIQEVIEVKLNDLPKGSLFEFEGTFAMKSEYRTKNGAIESFIIGSGEMFWGGTDNPKDQGNLVVKQYEFINN